VHEHKADMDEVERGFRQRIDGDVVSTYVKIGLTERFEKFRTDVGRDDVSLWTDAIA
jgi:hypothetical protein